MLFFMFIFPGVLFHQAKPALVLVGAFVGHSAWVGSAGNGPFGHHGHQVCIPSESLQIRHCKCPTCKERLVKPECCLTPGLHRCSTDVLGAIGLSMHWRIEGRKAITEELGIILWIAAAAVSVTVLFPLSLII